MDKALQEYLQSVKEETVKYTDSQLETKEYLQSIKEMEKWLEEKCDANPRN